MRVANGISPCLTHAWLSSKYSILVLPYIKLVFLPLELSLALPFLLLFRLPGIMGCLLGHLLFGKFLLVVLALTHVYN